MALVTSCMSILQAMSKLFSAAMAASLAGLERDHRRVLRRQVEHRPPGSIAGARRVQEAHRELLTHLAEPGEEAARGPREGLGRVALVHLVELRSVDPERGAVGDDLLGP